MDETLRTWGENIRLRREVLRMTQLDLADAVGVTQPTVHRWENGRIEPRRHHKASLAQVLMTDARILFPMVAAA